MRNVRHGGRILADQLAVQGCDRVFLVPGESFLAAIDGLHDLPGIEAVVCRQEGGAAMMAEAYGKLTGRPGVCMVTRGPGATNAAAGVHVAFQDSTPLVLVVGQVGREDAGPRGVPGDGLPPHVRRDGQVGGPGRPDRADPGIPEPRVPHRGVRAARAGGAGPAGGRARGPRRRAGRPPRGARGPEGGGGRRGGVRGDSSRSPSGPCSSWGAGDGRQRPPATSRDSPPRTTCRSAPRSAARTTSTTATRTTAATWGSVSIPR